MIRNKDRSGWFGASDTAMVMGRWDTVSFARWWMEKLGVAHNDFTSVAMQTGTALEHRVLDSLGIFRRDRQIKIRRLRLRVNLDGETPEKVVEVKTYGGAAFKVTTAYWRQCQVERFAAGKPVEIAAYRVMHEDYENWFLPIDADRLSIYPVEYDTAWVRGKYLPRLRYLSRCLRRGEWPDEGAID